MAKAKSPPQTRRYQGVITRLDTAGFEQYRSVGVALDDDGTLDYYWTARRGVAPPSLGDRFAAVHVIRHNRAASITINGVEQLDELSAWPL